jgi:hypothetical protein
MLRRVVSYKYTDVSEVLTASIIKALFALMMEAASTSEMPGNFYSTCHLGAALFAITI